MAQFLSDINEKAIAFIADWDESIGPTLIEQIPENPKLGDLEMVAIQIFMTFQTVFGESSEVKFDKTTLTMPFKSMDTIARILLETRPNEDVRGGLQPFIVVILVPDSVPEEKLLVFDPILANIAAFYKDSHKNSLKEFEQQLEERLHIAQEIDSYQIKIDDSYTLTTAVADFKKGIEFFQKKNWTVAYPLLRKSLIKFQNENQQKLIMETTYLIATLLVQLKKYHAAIPYFLSLGELAKTLQNQKYLEIMKFMLGFCSYKNNQFLEAIDYFNRISINSAKYINFLQYYSLKGRANAKLQLYDKAIDNLQKALEISMTLEENDILKRQRAQILYDLGLQFNHKAINILQKRGFSQIASESESNRLLLLTVENFTEAIEIWNMVGDYKNSVQIYQLIANIFGYLHQSEKQLQYLKTALIKAENISEISQQIKIINRIIQIQENNQMYEENVELLNRVLISLSQRAFIDLYTIAGFHLQIGRDLLKLDKINDAIMELLTALNAYKKLRIPFEEEKTTLDILYKIYQKIEDKEKIEYYSSQIDKISKKLQIKPATVTNPLGMVRDLWIFTTSGIEIFDYAPELQFEPTLLGGFLSAMQSFSLEISKNRMESFVIGEDRFTFYIEPDFDVYILGKSRIKDSEIIVAEILKVIYKRFASDYKEYLVNFSGNTEPFNNFKETILSMDFNLV